MNITIVNPKLGSLCGQTAKKLVDLSNDIKVMENNELVLFRPAGGCLAMLADNSLMMLYPGEYE